MFCPYCSDTRIIKIETILRQHIDGKFTDEITDVGYLCDACGYDHPDEASFMGKVREIRAHFCGPIERVIADLIPASGHAPKELVWGTATEAYDLPLNYQTYNGDYEVPKGTGFVWRQA